MCVDQLIAASRPLLAQVGADLRLDLLTGRAEDGDLLLGDVVRDQVAELLDRVGEGLGVGALELEHLEQRLVALGVLLVAVLDVVLIDLGGLAAQHRVDELLLGLAMRDEHVGEGLPDRVEVLGGVAQLREQPLEQAVVVGDEVDDVTSGRSAEVGRVVHSRRYPQGGTLIL